MTCFKILVQIQFFICESPSLEVQFNIPMLIERQIPFPNLPLHDQVSDLNSINLVKTLITFFRSSSANRNPGTMSTSTTTKRELRASGVALALLRENKFRF